MTGEDRGDRDQEQYVRKVQDPARLGVQSGWDYVILCRKVLPDRVDNPALLLPLLKIPDNNQRPPTLVLISNGIKFEDNHRGRHPKVPILSAVTVTRISLGPYLNFPSYLENPHSLVDPQLEVHSQSQLKCLAKLLRDGKTNDPEIYGKRDLRIVHWHKLAINASMNPTSILSGGLPSSNMVKEGGLRVYLEGCMTEVFEAAKIIFGIESFPPHLASIERILKSIETAGQRLKIKPSMLVDGELGRPLEIKATMGLPIRIATRAGIKLSGIQSMYAFLTHLQLTCFKNTERTRAKVQR
ncbi:hypothetical protein PSHT_00448 [Puccinia striiformis]|uniref:Ketopantoate reductase C-terminal domain-containing protein n=1 Tax=Puccinia striiformis TaxID=27350 RepID=A0A2S4WN77_9BASI|nr:hypothetical protein PSHT_00448 [Puccinia striiformis]